MVVGEAGTTLHTMLPIDVTILFLFGICAGGIHKSLPLAEGDGPLCLPVTGKKMAWAHIYRHWEQRSVL